MPLTLVKDTNHKMNSYLDQLFDFRRNQQFKKMRFSDFDIERVLQNGDKNQVLLVKNRRHTALGRFVMKKLDNRTNKKNFITNEILAGNRLKHANIARLLHYWTESDWTYLLFEHIDGKDLYDFLAENDFDPVEESQAMELFRQLVKAVKYCHKKGFVHGDLKLENIMITSARKIKLIDFGFSTPTDCHSTLSSFQGSLEYLCPEILQRKPYVGCKSETWSLGVILFTMLFGEFPFSEADRNQDFAGVSVVFPFSPVSQHAKDLISSMLAISPEERPDIEIILKHSWFTDSN